MLNAKTISIMMGTEERSLIDSDIIDCKAPSKNSVIKVLDVFNRPMSTKAISDLTGLSLPTVLLVLKFMRSHGDVTTSKGVDIPINTPTGSNHLLDNSDLNFIQSSNTGLKGVSFVARTKSFHMCHGRNVSLTFNNLLDASCARKSLELGVQG